MNTSAYQYLGFNLRVLLRVEHIGQKGESAVLPFVVQAVILKVWSPDQQN